MVAFVTLLLGLTAGLHTIEVAVSEPTARVEILLDGASAGVLTAEPWRLEVDLGAELAPHHLLAIARDASGGEHGRAEQWINLPHQPVEAQLLLAGGDEPRLARLIWSAVGQDDPREVSVSFDGEPLAVDDPGRIALPAYDPHEVHLLRAEVRFPGAEALAEVVFGGVFGEQVATEIQALALALESARRLPEPAELSDWLTADGHPAAVRAVDAGPADVVMVVDLAAHGTIQELKRANVVHEPEPPPRGERADPNLPGYTPQPGPRRRARSRTTQRVMIPAGLHERDRLRFVYPVEDPDRHDYRVFPVSEPFTLDHGGIFDVLTRVNLPADGAGSQRLADAVAVAGIQATAGHRRRIVVLVAGEHPFDSSRFRLPAVRRYLSRLRVPLVVWSLREPRGGVYRPRPRPPAGARAAPVLGASELGEVVEIASIKQLKAALGALRDRLDSQRIVWVEGHHLPQRFELSAAASGVRWAGAQN